MTRTTRPDVTTRRWALPALLALTTAVAACGKPGDDTSRTAPSTAAEPVPAPVGGTGIEAPAEGNAAVLGSLAAIEQNLIDITAHGQAHNLGGATAEFADAMHAAYQQDLAATQALGARDSDASKAIRARATGTLESLSAQTEENPYRNAFMAALTKEHAEALKIIDAELVPAADSEEVKRHLGEIRSAIAERYERAQAVISSR